MSVRRRVCPRLCCQLLAAAYAHGTLRNLYGDCPSSTRLAGGISSRSCVRVKGARPVGAPRRSQEQTNMRRGRQLLCFLALGLLAPLACADEHNHVVSIPPLTTSSSPPPPPPSLTPETASGMSGCRDLLLAFKGQMLRRGHIPFFLRRYLSPSLRLFAFR